MYEQPLYHRISSDDCNLRYSLECGNFAVDAMNECERRRRSKQCGLEDNEKPLPSSLIPPSSSLYVGLVIHYL
jgi:hypothetical protein